ncbi:uncharacterized protein METZ01_LOCUS139177 [marine metagenome]|uniref:Uncharacterized protein n=1 Tax=marine metagenome TaxID=408172 RepID=A0A381ZC34_9ZZZZ
MALTTKFNAKIVPFLLTIDSTI